MAYVNLSITGAKAKSTIEGSCNTSGILKSDGRGNITSATPSVDYATPSDISEANVLWVTYNSTPISDIVDAYNEGRQIKLKYTLSTNTYVYELNRVVQTNTYKQLFFQCVSAGTMSLYITAMKTSATETWTRTDKSLQEKLTAGSGISISGSTISAEIETATDDEIASYLGIEE